MVSSCVSPLIPSAILLLASIATAQWKPLGGYEVKGKSPVVINAKTGEGAVVKFTLASDCVWGCPGSVCYRVNVTSVEYQELAQKGVVTRVSLRFSYSSGVSSSHWKDVRVQGMKLCGRGPGNCGGWGSAGLWGTSGTAEFTFANELPPGPIGLPQAGGYISVKGKLSATDPKAFLQVSLGGGKASTNTCLFAQIEQLSNPHVLSLPWGKWYLGVAPPVCMGVRTISAGGTASVNQGPINPAIPNIIGLQIRYQWIISAPSFLRLSNAIRVTVHC